MRLSETDLEMLAKAYAPVVKEYVKTHVDPLLAKIAALEAKVDGYVLGRHATDYEDRDDF